MSEGRKVQVGIIGAGRIARRAHGEPGASHPGGEDRRGRRRRGGDGGQVGGGFSDPGGLPRPAQNPGGQSDRRGPHLLEQRHARAVDGRCCRGEEAHLLRKTDRARPRQDRSRVGGGEQGRRQTPGRFQPPVRSQLQARARVRRRRRDRHAAYSRITSRDPRRRRWRTSRCPAESSSI